MLKKLVVTSIVTGFALMTPALAQTPPATAEDQATSAGESAKAPKKHKPKKAAAEKTKAKSGAGSTDSEKLDGDSKQ